MKTPAAPRAALGWQVFAWFDKDDRKTWGESTWEFAKQIFPLLFMGVLAAGFFYGEMEPIGFFRCT